MPPVQKAGFVITSYSIHYTKLYESSDFGSGVKQLEITFRPSFANISTEERSRRISSLILSPMVGSGTVLPNTDKVPRFTL